MYLEKEVETMTREQLNTLQGERLQALVKRLYEVPYYREKFKEKGVKPGDIKSAEDIKHLPFTTKQDLRDTYPHGMFAVPMEDVVRMHASSGTTGKPVVVGYTKNDINTWGNLMARCMMMAGLSKKDIVQNAYGYGLFTGGLGVHYGAEALGATVVPMSGGNTAKQLMLMQDFGTTALTCTPTYALYMAEEAHAGGVDWEKIKLKVGIFGAEPWSNAMRKELEERWNITAIDIYGLSEVLGPGVACECQCQNGLHINEDHFIVEVIDPETGEPLPDGEKGELVFTSLTKEAFPVVRYRTRDISVLHKEQCQCGRTLVRMERVTGRTDDMLIIRGVNVFPSQVESVLLEFGETEPHYLLVVERKGTMDDLEIWVEVSDSMFSDKVRGLEDLEKRLRSRVLSVLGISAKIKLVEPKSIPRSEGKAKRIVDKRPNS
ncbi:MAG: phenylacetate--CoA ligase [Firmicutes bacterium]|nr:phenylacetate--CoA ligase [Bacillota bacterium]